MARKIFPMPRTGDLKRLAKQKKREEDRQRLREDALAKLAAAEAEAKKGAPVIRADALPNFAVPVTYQWVVPPPNVLVWTQTRPPARERRFPVRARFIAFHQATVFFTSAGQVTVERLITHVKRPTPIASIISIK